MKIILGLGLELLKEIICMCTPDIVVHLGSKNPTSDPIPDLSVSTLMKTPVFVPYRVKSRILHNHWYR